MGRKLYNGAKEKKKGANLKFWAILKLNFETYTRYYWVADEEQKKKKDREKKVLGVLKGQLPV